MPGKITVLFPELSNELGGTQEIAERCRFLGGQRQRGSTRVRVVCLGNDEVGMTVPMGDDTHATTGRQNKILARPDPR